ncbi:pullulanase 1, chloroplastic-like [Triticum aestivum]|uniref:pullulanase 1, chloroplastic-like n=1 Tax=Triticum aestivum TaxID=4565 RepID=UPI001D02C4E4|nr:pullulanase 1, chloroplastic-like [Triticum aestivum]
MAVEVDSTWKRGAAAFLDDPFEVLQAKRGRCSPSATAASVADLGINMQFDPVEALQSVFPGADPQVTQKFPFINSYRVFRVPSSVVVGSLVKCQLVVASFSADGKHVDVTGLQLPGMLDDMFAYTGPLGAIFSEDSVSLHLWAPTTQDVSVWFLDGPPALL